MSGFERWDVAVADQSFQGGLSHAALAPHEIGEFGFIPAEFFSDLAVSQFGLLDGVPDALAELAPHHAGLSSWHTEKLEESFVPAPASPRKK
ncbi:hypothetical protein PV646_10465 [Streptomyces sp. ID05-26A]|nr:hypothetical protein [Streptomyces sp. ID05-26A]